MAEHIQDRKNPQGKGLSLFYYNPLILKALQTIIYDERCIIYSDKKEAEWVCFYSLDKDPDI